MLPTSGKTGTTWAVIEWKPTALGFATGAVAGLVAITPASGFVGPMPAMIIGVCVSLISFFAIKLKHILRYDDTLDVFGVHGVGGTWGAIATGLFASVAVNSAGANGLFYGGGFTLLGKQCVAAGSAILYAGLVTLILVKALGAVMGLRVDAEAEEAGLDLTQHGETGYNGIDAEGALLSVAE